MVWSKPAPSKDWPMHESLYEWSGSATKVGRLFIRKSTYEKAERGREIFPARGFLRVHDAGQGMVRLGGSEIIVAPWTLEKGVPIISVKVEYSAEGSWRWVCERALELPTVRRFVTARWIV